MIVVDTNVIAYLVIDGVNTPSAKALYRQDQDWIAPVLWKSEFRNVVATYYRNKYIDLTQALFLVEQAEKLMRNHEYYVKSSNVLNFVAESGCSAYDCEFIALARNFNVKLVTTDQKIIKAFPKVAVNLKDQI